MTHSPAGTYIREYCSSEIKSRIFGFGNGQKIFDAYGPDNPSITDTAYLIERRFGGCMLAAHVIETWKEESKVQMVNFYRENSMLKIEVIIGENKRWFALALPMDIGYSR